MGLRSQPESILMPDGGTLELSDGGDADTARIVLERLTAEFRGTIMEQVYRNLMGDMEREREYWFLEIQGRQYILMRCTAPEAPPGVCVMGPTKTPDDLALFRSIAGSFGAVEQDRRPPVPPPWWRFWGK